MHPCERQTVMKIDEGNPMTTSLTRKCILNETKQSYMKRFERLNYRKQNPFA